MTQVFVTLLLSIVLFSDVDRIAQINSIKAEAKKAYISGDYKTAVEKYKYLIDSLQVNEDEVKLNLANAFFQINDSTNASLHYSNLSQSGIPGIRSRANQQLGVLANRAGQYEKALDHFKQALKASPANEDARYNYEMVKKKLEEQQKEQEQQKDQQKKDQQDDQKKDQKKDQNDQQNKDQKQEQKDKQDKENKEQEQKQKEQEEQDKKNQEKSDQQEENPENDKKENIPPSVSEKLKNMEMSEEKAKMILEAMKNQEIQYLQQNKRKATKPKDKGKPDW